MAIFPSYGEVKGPPRARPVRSVTVYPTSHNSDIPRLLDLRSMNSGNQVAMPDVLLPFAVYKARLNVLAQARDKGFVPGRLVTTTSIANKYGNNITDIAINDCALVKWALFSLKDEGWKPIKLEWFDNTTSCHEITGLVLITTNPVKES